MFYYTSFNMNLPGLSVTFQTTSITGTAVERLAGNILSNPVIRVKPHLLFRPESLYL